MLGLLLLTLAGVPQRIPALLIGVALDGILLDNTEYANHWRVQVGTVEALPDDFVGRARADVDD